MPYAGYFRLFHHADLFVVYDCVQFLRRGWIHRNRLPNQQGELQWLTLPLQKAPQTIKIKDLNFSNDAAERWREQFNCFPSLSEKLTFNTDLKHSLFALNQSPLDYLIKNLKYICDALTIPFNIIKSSELNLPADLKAQERILTIAQHFKATRYINSPGGRELYDETFFNKNNIRLEFLSNYQGSHVSMLHRMLNEDIPILRQEIISQF